MQTVHSFLLELQDVVLERHPDWSGDTRAFCRLFVHKNPGLGLALATQMMSLADLQDRFRDHDMSPFSATSLREFADEMFKAFSNVIRN